MTYSARRSSASTTDKDFAAEAMKVIEFAPDYPTAPDMSQKVRAMIQATPQDADLHQRLHAQRAEELRDGYSAHASLSPSS